MSRSQESTNAIKAVWMEGYNQGRRDERLSKAPVVEISRADIEATYEPGFCQHPGDCPCSALRVEPLEAMTTPTPDTVEQAALGWFRANGLSNALAASLTTLLREQREAARREGFQAGAEAGAKVADRHAECWFEDRQHNRADDADQIAADIRALPEMKKE